VPAAPVSYTCACYYYTVCVVWRQLWLSKHYDFDLADPLLHRTPSASGYNALTDRSLKGFMRRPRMLRRLDKHGLLTGDGYVRCSLQELNRYRDYLHRCYQQKMYFKKVSNNLVLTIIVIIIKPSRQ